MQATARPDHFFGLERLLSPLTTREFLDGYREQKHLLIRGTTRCTSMSFSPLPTSIMFSASQISKRTTPGS